MTVLQRIILNAGSWAPRPGRAVLPVSAFCEGETAYLVTDIAHELAKLISWASYGTTIIPADSAPEGVGGTAQHDEAGSMVVALDPNQPGPEYVEGNPAPDNAEVRLVLSQAVTANLEDRELFIERRIDLVDALVVLSGAIG